MHLFDFFSSIRLGSCERLKAEVMNEKSSRIASGKGFIAALDQSGGSTPKALAAYGVEASQFSNDEEMFGLVHEMRTRIMTSESFSGDKVLGAILFENTMDRDVNGVRTADYLWQQKRVVPFLKVDKGLADEANGVQLMKPIDGLDELLGRANEANIYGTKMRSVIKQANKAGISEVVAQQFEVGNQIIDAGLMPIIEPEVDIHCPDKAQVEEILAAELAAGLDALAADRQVMFKLTLPDSAGFYDSFVADERVLKVVALSGGYSRELANEKLAANSGVIASFSRALSEGLHVSLSDEEFNALLARSIEEIYTASIT